MTYKVVKFEAAWCGPCQALKPIFEQVQSQVEGVEFVTVDIDNDSKTAVEMKITSVPTLVFLKDGEEQDRIVGLVPADRLLASIRKLKGE